MAQTVWRGHLTFGLVSFPIRLYKAARAAKVPLRRLYRRPAPFPDYDAESQASASTTAPEPARRQPVDQTPPTAPEVNRTYNRITTSKGTDVPNDEPQPNDLVKGYEYGKNEYVLLEADELARLTPETSREMELLEFVDLHEVDPIFFETSYYVTPEEVGVRPYALLFEAMREAGRVGVAKLAMHRRDHIVLIRPGRSGLIAHTMFYVDEVRAEEEYKTDTEIVNPRELSLAKHLIEGMAGPFTPQKFRDTRRERLEQLIHEKLAGNQVAAEPVRPPQKAPVLDIMAALQRSLAAMKKPAEAAPIAKVHRKRRAS